MTEDQLAILITDKVIKDVQFWISIIGFVGVVTGVILTTIGNVILYNIQQKSKNKNDLVRKSLLKKMLDNPKFKEGRSIETLSRVTGTSKDECHRLLIELDARGFKMEDGRIGWTYIKNRPIDEL